jgi:hypothetical protein
VSITLELPDLSPELARQLDALPEEERGRFAAALMERALEVPEDDPDDPAALAVPHQGPRLLTPEAAARIRVAMDAPPQEPNEHWRRAAENYRRLTGKSLSS